MKNIIIVMLLTFVGFSTQAQEKKNKNAKVEFHVSGNCEMCKKRVEKTALSVSGVKTADWHMDCGTLYLIVNEEKTDVSTIQKAIAKAGHDTDEVKATQTDYDNLHTCCQYERK
ncbi:MAG: heavy-metal-associated domain-containing protein [Flavobacterium sp.]